MILAGADYKGQFDPRFLMACILTAVALFVLGALKVDLSLCL
jgi:hypothetical protein